MFKVNSSYNKGFTLIELLVVIAIIGLLSSIVLASLNTARVKARNAKRFSDFRQIQIALDAYYNDHGSYPPPYPAGWSGVDTGGCNGNAGNGTASGPTAYIQGLTPTYISVLPVDPAQQAADCTGYLYNSNGVDYAFLDHNIVAIDPGFNTGDYNSRTNLLDPVRDSGSNGCIVDGSAFWAWKIYSPGAVCW